MLPYPFQALVAIIIFSLVHLFANKARLLNVAAHSRFLSLGSGVAIAYIFVDLLPKLSKNDTVVKGALVHIFLILKDTFT